MRTYTTLSVLHSVASSQFYEILDTEYLSGHKQQNPLLRSSALPSDKGQGGETLSDVTLPGDQTPFSYDVD